MDRAEDRDIILLCNPRAGGRWKELANILDSPEIKAVRWIVTDSLDDIGPAISSFTEGTKLVCIYGGDGTIQRILDRMFTHHEEAPSLAFIGGGTMNVASRWCGMSYNPGKNFRYIVQAYLSGQLLYKEVPLLKVQQGPEVHYGFTFGMGPTIRVLNAYETGQKGMMAALGVVGKSLLAIWSNYPPHYASRLSPMEAEILMDGEPLPFSRYSILFCNNTGQIHIGVKPFLKIRTRDTFFFGAYAIDKKEVALLLPFLFRGVLPVDPKSLLKEVSTLKKMVLSYLGKGSYPTDPRYINDIASEVVIHTNEPFYTVDGEIIASNRQPFKISVGPTIKLTINPTAPQGTRRLQPSERNKGER